MSAQKSFSANDRHRQPAAPDATEWGRRAAGLYQPAYANRYRETDDRIRHGELVLRFGTWLGGICDSFSREISALDLGCGTGRYFWALRHVRDLVGIDASRAMLDQARAPVDAGRIAVGRIDLIEGDFLSHSFEPDQFDLVYSIGVLAEHTPFDERIASRVHQWLRPGGRFALTTVHPRSFSVPRTLKRRMGEWLVPFSVGSSRDVLRRRLLSDGQYADEERLRSVLGSCGFAIESVDTYRSDIHLHCLCVAKKAA